MSDAQAQRIKMEAGKLSDHPFQYLSKFEDQDAVFMTLPVQERVLVIVMALAQLMAGTVFMLKKQGMSWSPARLRGLRDAWNENLEQMLNIAARTP